MDKPQACPFCHETVRNRALAESEHARVIFSNPRLTKGHLLIVPKRHVEEPWGVTPQEQNEIVHFIWHFQKLLSQTLGTGCDLRENYRPFLPQGRLKVDHLHYHLIPRAFEDDIYRTTQVLEKDLFIDLSQNEMKEVAALLHAQRNKL